MTKKEQKFIAIVWDFYKEHGRKQLPWRKTKNPYKILVSEMMLQQTQVARVIPKYKTFLDTFPNVSALASASLSDVLILWQGLGYNRRAKMLHLCAKQIVNVYGGSFPKTKEKLKELPGIGPYTASAVCTFAYNKTVVLIETNVRTVFLHHFFRGKTNVTDAELLPSIERTLDVQNPSEWYYALMDYGSHLKKSVGNENRRSAHHVVQSTFKGSDRQIRGALIRLLAKGAKSRTSILLELSAFEDIRVDAQVQALLDEGMICHSKQKYSLPK